MVPSQLCAQLQECTGATAVTGALGESQAPWGKETHN
jgi:hypothetical protein